jgi:RNA polymerase sigma-70 factor, ECF subfamily
MGGVHDPDEALIRALYAEHGSVLLGYVRRRLGDRMAAEDIVQETLLRAWRNAHVLDNGRGSVRAWLLTVAHNLMVDRARSRAVRPNEVATLPVRYTPLIPDHAESLVDAMRLREELEKLPPAQRTVLVEIYWNGRSAAEVAEQLGIPVGTVKSRLYYGLRAMRAALADAEPARAPLALAA